MSTNESGQTALKLLASHDEAGNVRTFVFDSAGLKWIAGQSQGYVLPQAGDTESENERWFTIASAPSEGTIHISTRISQSRFKQALNRLQPGQEILAHDIDGDFTWEEVSDQPILMVAGGIGVTPFRSMLLERKATGKALNATLLYFSRDEQIPFRRELTELGEQHKELSVRYVVGQPITSGAIVQLIPDVETRIVYISGAEPMVESLGADLQQRGITIKQDWFPGYDDKNY